MYSGGLNAGMETSAPLVNGLVNNALFHSNSHTHQDATSNRSQPVDCCPSFCSQLDWGKGCSAATNLEVHMGNRDHLNYCTFVLQAVNDAQNVRVDTACGKDHDQQNLSTVVICYRNIYNHANRFRYLKILTNKSVYKLTTDNLQKMSINVLIRLMSEHKSFTKIWRDL